MLAPKAVYCIRFQKEYAWRQIMKIEQLQYFIEVVKAGSVNAASKKVYISQQSLNKSLHSLEDELGFDILNRTRRGVSLTKEGEVVFNAAQAIVARFEQMQEQVQRLKTAKNDTLKGRMNIHISPMLSISILPMVYVDYMHAYPGVQVYCQEKYRDDIVKEVSHHPGDVGFVLVPNTIEVFFNNIPSNVHMEELNSYPIFMAMSPKHPLAHQRSLSVHSVAEYPLIVYEAGGSKGIHAFQNMGNMHVVLSTNNYHMCEELLREGQTLMYSYPKYIGKRVFSDFIHLPVNTKEAHFELYLVYNKEASNQERRLIDSFSGILQQYL